jgi:hypothetical protein
LNTKIVLVDLFDLNTVHLTAADQRIKRQVARELHNYRHSGATEAQIQREMIRAYRRLFYTPEVVATWVLNKHVKEGLLSLQQQGYQIIFFGEHMQQSYDAIEQWCQKQLPGVPFDLALNDFPSHVEEQNVFLLGQGQDIFGRRQWAFCLIMMLVRLYRARHVLVVTYRKEVQDYYEQAKEHGDCVEIQFVKSLKGHVSEEKIARSPITLPIDTIPKNQLHAFLVYLADGGTLPFPRYKSEVWDQHDDIPFKKYPTEGPEWEQYKALFQRVSSGHPHRIPEVLQAYQAWLVANGAAEPQTIQEHVVTFSLVYANGWENPSLKVPCVTDDPSTCAKMILIRYPEMAGVRITRIDDERYDFLSMREERHE